MSGQVDSGFPSAIATKLSASALTHSSRANVFQREATWRIGADALERDGGEPADAAWYAHVLRFYLRLLWPWSGIRIDAGGVARFPYAHIAEVRVLFDPTRFDAQRHRCDLTLRNGMRATFWSTHYVSVGEFEDRGASYRPFVRALVGHAAAANPACRFRAGKRPLVYWAELIFLLLMAALLVFVLALVGGSGLSDLVLVKLAIVLALLPLLWRYARKNRPRRFQPAEIPPDVLPERP
jgi:hypothetical protein